MMNNLWEKLSLERVTYSKTSTVRFDNEKNSKHIKSRFVCGLNLK